jgi:hypothetical protein
LEISKELGHIVSRYLLSFRDTLARHRAIVAMLRQVHHSSQRVSASAGPEAGCTTAPAKLALGKPLSRGNRGNNADAAGSGMQLAKLRVMGRDAQRWWR